ncbi:aminopeptidase N [Mesosutterella sp. AGMB02718]|uniref:Aminopeptidase N n=1 Tax=Mesosutterella faecium TaxID=2925194 RepID=A0ABT7IMC8_9BURK|nr:aminopeptidase N [Mesosutterella sp. AGMB02718]MDL2059073.1 aminopeptidase N [Mesosutterella sp. AGMB02718]
MSSSVVYRSDYKEPDYRIESVNLVFDLDPQTSTVFNTMKVSPLGAQPVELVLDADGLELVSIYENGVQLPQERYSLTEKALTVHGINKPATLTIVNKFHPLANTLLSGIYISNGNFMSQCESQGFRRITYFPDHPDILTHFHVEIRADKEKYPVLLSNGNLVRRDELENGRHLAVWDDPSLKPCYLFALVAGNFVKREEKIKLANGKDCLLQVWVEPQNKDRTAHTLESIKKAIRWDEQRWGLEYDLERFMLVATDDFNFGAMENKGLNIFNTRYVLASPQIATDLDYFNIESVVGHEYFHNWTGDRVTLRDWFQLTLKEGLTVFRDQEFSRDMLGKAAAIKRIMDVRFLRSRQFPEDAGPMAHPVRPESYREINNFYTTTVYEKGAEIYRMLQTLLGREKFKEGLRLYLERNDGRAATCEDFINAMAQASERDLGQFFRWYGQAGTPRVTVKSFWDPEAHTYTLVASQSTPETPGQADKKPFLIPLAVGLLDPSGKDIPLQLEDETEPAGTTRVLELRDAENEWTFVNIDAKPIPSLLRDFSAPVILNYPYSRSELAFLARHDSDPFNRWDAMNRLMLEALNDMVDAIETGARPSVDQDLLAAFEQMLTDERLAPAFRAISLTLPDEQLIGERRTLIDPEAIRSAREELRSVIGRRYSSVLLKIAENYQTPGEYSPDAESAGKRALKNLAFSYLLAGGNPKALLALRSQFEQANNLTDQLSALTSIVNSASPAKLDMLVDAARKWNGVPVLINKWLTVQASAIAQPGEVPVLSRVRELMASGAFNIANPNSVYALILAFCNNAPEFHRPDGSGYRFWLEMIQKLCKVNAFIAARIARVMDNWRRYTPERARQMHDALKLADSLPNLPTGVREVLDKALGKQAGE